MAISLCETIEVIVSRLLQDHPEFTTFEAHQLAIQLQRNQLLEEALFRDGYSAIKGIEEELENIKDQIHDLPN